MTKLKHLFAPEFFAAIQKISGCDTEARADVASILNPRIVQVVNAVCDDTTNLSHLRLLMLVNGEVTFLEERITDMSRLMLAWEESGF